MLWNPSQHVNANIDGQCVNIIFPLLGSDTARQSVFLPKEHLSNVPNVAKAQGYCTWRRCVPLGALTSTSVLRLHTGDLPRPICIVTEGSPRGSCCRARQLRVRAPIAFPQDTPSRPSRPPRAYRQPPATLHFVWLHLSSTVWPHAGRTPRSSSSYQHRSAAPGCRLGAAPVCDAEAHPPGEVIAGIPSLASR